ncbi:MAG: ATPase [Lachnospiraceae bacterium]|nr:ATPase [Lachnospiraceae bacterium]
MAQENQAKAMFDAKNKIDLCLKEGISFNQETTLVGTMKTIQKAKAQGYFVDMYYVGLESAEIAIERVANRVQHGGHGVKEDIRRRYIKSKQNLIKAIQICYEVKIYDNSFTFVKIASFSQGKPLFKYNTLGDGWFKQLLQDNMCNEKMKEQRSGKESVLNKLTEFKEVEKTNSELSILQETKDILR